ncbi:hypothetical protein ACWATR_06350 [Nostoc sp. UIC 10890]
MVQSQYLNVLAVSLQWQQRSALRVLVERSGPILSTTKLHRLDENIRAVSVELTPDDLRDIDDAASKITVQGARYPEKLEQMTGR